MEGGGSRWPIKICKKVHPTMKKVYRLVHDTARRLAADMCLQAPDGWVVTIQEPTRSLEQNSRLWVLLSAVSEQVEWYGKKLTPENWKNVFSASLKKQEVTPGIDGGFVVMGISTSKMSKRELGDLMTLIEAFASERNVKFKYE